MRTTKFCIHALTLTFMVLTTAMAWADTGYDYIAADGTTRNTYTDDGIPDASIIVINADSKPTKLAGWYVVTGKVDYTNTIEIVGYVNLILTDGASMNVNYASGCISINGNLTIYGQANGTGSITATNEYSAAIFFPYNSSLTLVGGNITAISNNGYGISVEDGDSFTLVGGTVTANSYNVSGGITIASGWAYTDGGLNSTTGSISPTNGTTYQPEWKGNGNSSSDPYLIKTPADLNLLAMRVNSGTSYSGKYFQLANDITYTHKADNEEGAGTENNYTAIGGRYSDNNKDFCGHFDGNHQTISGIRIYKGGSSSTDDYQGLFGIIGSGAEVNNIILADTRITGYVNVGGIVGKNDAGSVENCHVLSDVTIYAVYSGSYYHGGIVGGNGGSVNGCTSAASISYKIPNTYN